MELAEALGIWTCIACALAFLPLLTFAGCLFRTRRTGLSEYGRLALIHSRLFHRRWIEGQPGPELLGVPDISSLIDLEGGYRIVKDMRLVPFGLRDVSVLLMATLFPFVPALLTEIPLSAVLATALKTVVGIGR